MIHGYGAQAVRDAEAPALAAGEPLMRHAAFALAVRTAALLAQHGIAVPGARALVLVGGGNNGGDGLFAAADLTARGMQVTCVLAHHTPHPAGLAAARRAGVELVDLTAASSGDLARLAARADVWLDALAGIGVRGTLRGVPAEVVHTLIAVRTGATSAAGGREPLVVAVDVPSGIGADPGAQVPDDGVLTADLTVTMGAPKAALLLPPGARHAGRIQVVDLGLTRDFAAQQATVCRLTPAEVADRWLVPEPADHKYTRGVVGLTAGSSQYPGAALLCAHAALGVGIGMVRYLGPPDVAATVISAHPEVVPAAGRVQARVIGPGMADDDELAEAMRPALRGWGLGPDVAAGDPADEDPAAEEGDGVAVVLDAGALTELPHAPDTLIKHPVVLTPHAGELRDLLTRLGTEVTRGQIEADPWHWAHTAADRTGTTVLLKGPITIIAPPGTGPGYSQADGTPWLATAGSGDMLAGILGAVLAQAAVGSIGSGDVAAWAAAAVVVHGRAAALAGGPLQAGHLAQAVPAAIASILDERR